MTDALPTTETQIKDALVKLGWNAVDASESANLRLQGYYIQIDRRKDAHWPGAIIRHREHADNTLGQEELMRYLDAFAILLLEPDKISYAVERVKGYFGLVLDYNAKDALLRSLKRRAVEFAATQLDEAQLFEPTIVFQPGPSRLAWERAIEQAEKIRYLATHGTRQGVALGEIKQISNGLVEDMQAAMPETPEE